MIDFLVFGDKNLLSVGSGKSSSGKSSNCSDYILKDFWVLMELFIHCVQTAPTSWFSNSLQRYVIFVVSEGQRH